jgi:hypothetical protein
VAPDSTYQRHPRQHSWRGCLSWRAVSDPLRVRVAEIHETVRLAATAPGYRRPFRRSAAEALGSACTSQFGNDWDLIESPDLGPDREHCLRHTLCGAYQSGNHGTHSRTRWDATEGIPNGHKAFPDGGLRLGPTRDGVSLTGSQGVRGSNHPPHQHPRSRQRTLRLNAGIQRRRNHCSVGPPTPRFGGRADRTLPS